VRSLLVNASDTDDVVQQTCTLMWQKFDQFTPGTDFVAWAFKIARYSVIAHVRKNRRDLLLFDDELLDLLADDLAQQQPEDEYIETLRRCLARLPRRERQLIELRYRDEVAPGDLATRTGVSLGHIYRLLDGAQRALLECIRSFDRRVTP
jgi:RNA polymerase sigma-70 factor (ECF subfamily)